MAGDGPTPEQCSKWVKEAVMLCKAADPEFQKVFQDLGQERELEVVHDTSLLVSQTLNGEVDTELGKAGLESTYIFHHKGRNLFVVDKADIRIYDVDDVAGDIIHIGSIAVEAIFLIIGLFGVEVKMNAVAIERIAKEIGETVVSSSAMMQTVAKITAAVASKSWPSVGKYIIELLSQLGAGKLTSIIWTALKESMKWYDWIISGVGLVATIIAAVATGGVALVAKIALTVADSVTFILKCVRREEIMQLKTPNLSLTHPSPK